MKRRRNPSDAEVQAWIKRLRKETGSPKRLEGVLRLQAALEKHLGNGRKLDADNVMEAINEAMDGHGVEAIRDLRVQDRHWWDVVALYVNVGDSYVTTILYDVENDEFMRTEVGEWVYEYENSHPESEL